jgi:hypothetical protein
MASQKEQKQLTDRNKNVLSTILNRKDSDGLHFKEVCSFILAKMNLEFDKTYTIHEIVERVIESGNEINTIRNQKFDSDFYQGIKGDFISDFQKKIVSRIILDSPDEFHESLKEFNDVETIDVVDIIHSQNMKGEKEELIRIKGKSGKLIITVKVPY